MTNEVGPNFDEWTPEESWASVDQLGRRTAYERVRAATLSRILALLPDPQKHERAIKDLNAKFDREVGGALSELTTAELNTEAACIEARLNGTLN